MRNSVFDSTRMDLMIPRKLKKLYYDEVRGDLLRRSNGKKTNKQKNTKKKKKKQLQWSKIKLDHYRREHFFSFWHSHVDLLESHRKVNGLCYPKWFLMYISCALLACLAFTIIYWICSSWMCMNLTRYFFYKIFSCLPEIKGWHFMQSEQRKLAKWHHFVIRWNFV